MNNEQLTAKILSFEPSAEVKEGIQYLTTTVASDKFHAFAKNLRESKDTNFDYLFCLTGMDYGDSFGVIYYLESTSLKHQLVLKTACADKEKPVLDTVCDIWRTAEFLEREVFDLFGIDFNNHPDMRRIFLEEDWVGHPLRKDYSDNNIIVK
jgi:NADH:ubiquinone oxidoreductase subunit C